MSTGKPSTGTAATPVAGLASTIQLQLGDSLQKLAPLFVTIGHILNVLFPYAQMLYKQGLALWIALQPYHPEEFGPILFGLILSFFGGHFFTLFAAIEAYRMCGFDETKKHITELYNNYIKVREVNEKDNEVDDNNDGIPDVEQISAQELFTRKLSLFLKTMDPAGVSKALSGLWMGFLSVVAVLRLKFAQTIALGSTVGNIIETAIGERVLRPIISRAIPESHQKWVPVIVTYICKTAGVSIAWTVQRVISAFYSSLRGAGIFTAGLAAYLSRRGGSFGGVIAATTTEGAAGYWLLTGIVAWTGFVWQIQSGFSLPFPFNILLLPFSILEWFITWMVAVEQ